MIALAWSALMLAAPFMLAPAAIIWFGRWLDRRTDADSFAADFIPHAADVAAIEAALPKMAGTE